MLHLKEDLWGASVIAWRELWSNLRSVRTLVMVLLLALIFLGASSGFSSLSQDEGGIGAEESYSYLVIAMDPDAHLDDLVVHVYRTPTFAPVAGRNVSLAYESELDPRLTDTTDGQGVAVLRNLTTAVHILRVELRQEGGGPRGAGGPQSSQVFVGGQDWYHPLLYIDVGSTDLDSDNWDDDMVAWVVDSNATPVAGADVTLNEVISATTDASGVARFEDVKEGEYSVNATANGLQGHSTIGHEPTEQRSGVFFFALEGPDQVLNLVAQIAIGMLGPIYVIAMCFDTISREKLSGSIDYLVSRPMGRRAVVAGKWAGVVAAIMMPIMLVSMAGVWIIARSSDRSPSGDVVVGFLVYTFLLVGVFALLQMLFSTLAKTTGTAVLSGVGLWIFFFMLFSIIIVLLDAYTDLSSAALRNASYLNPVDLYALSMQGAVAGELSGGMPTWAPPVALVVWMLVMAAVTTEVFRRRATE